MECEKKHQCLNSDKCYRCLGGHLFKAKKTSPKQKKPPVSQKEGMAFQRKIVNLYEEKMNQKTAYETPNSGALWNNPGDVITEEFLIECKERGKTRGKESFTITKTILDKVKQESGISGRIPLVVFGFKEQDESYAIIEFDYLLELIQKLNQKGE